MGKKRKIMQEIMCLHDYLKGKKSKIKKKFLHSHRKHFRDRPVSKNVYFSQRWPWDAHLFPKNVFYKRIFKQQEQTFSNKTSSSYELILKIFKMHIRRRSFKLFHVSKEKELSIRSLFLPTS